MNRRLKNNMLEAVENQLQMNEPKCTKETFERLAASGVNGKKAKEMIAAVLLEEMYYVLKNNEPFNEQQYAEKLSRLESGSLPEAKNNYVNISMKEIIQSIENNYDGPFPKEALQEIIRRKDEAIPVLLDILKKVLENPKEYAENQDYFGHIYAVYLLAQFRVKELYPVFIELVKLPEDLAYELFGDVMGKGGSRILASVCGGEIGPIKELITDSKVDSYIRGAAVKSLAILVLQGVLPREDVIEYYRTLLTNGLDDEEGCVVAEVISSSNDLYPGELMEEIRAAFENELVDESLIDLETVEETLTFDKEWVLEEYKLDENYQYINDTIEELHWWTCFKSDSSLEDDSKHICTNTQTVVKDFKTGRNDPCPCGSGKKYKKCCGK